MTLILWSEIDIIKLTRSTFQETTQRSIRESYSQVSRTQPSAKRKEKKREKKKKETLKWTRNHKKRGSIEEKKGETETELIGSRAIPRIEDRAVPRTGRPTKQMGLPDNNVHAASEIASTTGDTDRQRGFSGGIGHRRRGMRHAVARCYRIRSVHPLTGGG